LLASREAGGEEILLLVPRKEKKRHLRVGFAESGLLDQVQRVGVPHAFDTMFWQFSLKNYLEGWLVVVVVVVSGEVGLPVFRSSAAGSYLQSYTPFHGAFIIILIQSRYSRVDLPVLKIPLIFCSVSAVL